MLLSVDRAIQTLLKHYFLKYRNYAFTIPCWINGIKVNTAIIKSKVQFNGKARSYRPESHMYLISLDFRGFLVCGLWLFFFR